MRDKINSIMNRIKNIDIFGKKAFSVLYSLALSCIVLICVAQIGLRNMNTRQLFTKIDTYEGAYFAASTEVPDTEVYKMVLDVTSDCLDEALIYVNGEKYSDLVNGENQIVVTTSSVIEIYSPKGKSIVMLSDISEELTLYTKQTEITAEKELKLFGRVGIK